MIGTKSIRASPAGADTRPARCPITSPKQRGIEYDLAYLRNWSLRFDLQIVLKTILFVLKRAKRALSHRVQLRR